MSNYDINNPSDIGIMEHDFNCIKAEEWETYIAFAQLSEHKTTFSFRDITILKPEGTNLEYLDGRCY